VYDAHDLLLGVLEEFREAGRKVARSLMMDVRGLRIETKYAPRRYVPRERPTIRGRLETLTSLTSSWSAGRWVNAPCAFCGGPQHLGLCSKRAV
jgi:hypothetical protein